MRNGQSWDSRYLYSAIDIGDLLDYYFPSELCLRKGLAICKINLDADGGLGLRQRLGALQGNNLKRVYIQLSLFSPNGNRDSAGNLLTHATALIIDYENKRVIYQDPYGKGMDQKAWDQYSEAEKICISRLKPILEEQLPDFEILEPCLAQQQDKCSCVPLTIHNLVEFDRCGAFPEVPDVDAIRDSHRPILLAADRKRELAAQQKIHAGMEAVSNAICVQCSEEFNASSGLDGLHERVKALLEEYYSQNLKMGALGMLIDASGALSKTGKQLSDNLYSALKTQLIIHSAAASHVQRTKNSAAVSFDFERLENDTVKQRLYDVVKTSLVLKLNFSRPASTPG